MAVDKLVDSAQLNADLTSVANAIRTKGGTSGQLQFPQGFVSAIGNIPSGGGGPSSAICFEDFIMPSVAFSLQNCVPNLIKNGGCVHIVYTLQANSQTADKNLIGFGYGNPTTWSLTSPAIGAFFTVSKGGTNTNIYLRGAGNTSIALNSRADVNGKIDVKLYADHLIDVNTSMSYEYSTAVSDFFESLNQHDYITVMTGNNGPFSGAVIERWAIEET